MEAHLMQKVTPATSRRKLLDSFIFFFTSQHGGGLCMVDGVPDEDSYINLLTDA